MTDIRHKAILASAGSGKTFQLAHRYIRLLAGDGPGRRTLPDRICAMTFTRKAAGEIFDSIAGYLCEAAADQAAAELTARERLGMPDMTRGDFVELLRTFVDNVHCCRIGTMDSFIVGIAKAFPLELGIPMSLQVADPGGALAMETQQSVLDSIITSVNEKDSAAFLEAFKKATFGHEEKGFGELLEKFIDKLRPTFVLCPDPAKWGAAEAIWGPTPRWLNADSVSDDEMQIITDWSMQLPAKVKEALDDTAAALNAMGPRSPWPDILKRKMFDLLLENIDALREGKLEAKFGRTVVEPPPEVCAVLYRLVMHVFNVEYSRVLEQTSGLFELLSRYEDAHNRYARATGSFSFADIQYLLAGSNQENDAPTISRTPDLPDRIYIDYRMDCKLDHWLLDEFQDTSDVQWSVFENLIDEIVLSQPDEKRSFFYVGDIKQAIYSWRGGNRDLFLDVLAKYPNIETEDMEQTRRCSVPVVEAVNDVFGLLPDLLPEATRSSWSAIWRQHEASNTDTPGHCSLLRPTVWEEGDDDIERRCELIADLLKEIQPSQRGLEVGILVRNNSTGRRIVDTLRRLCHEEPALVFVHEGESAVVENQTAQVLTALVRLAAHPGDDYAWQYLQMTPVASLLKSRKVDRDNISITLLAELEEEGFQGFVQKWGHRLNEHHALGEYGLECLSRLDRAAAEFDTTGSRDVNSFLSFIDAYAVRERAASTAVRVMTVHQSKGLGFDVVILPDLDGANNMLKARAEVVLAAGDRADPEWVLRMPRTKLADNDPAIAGKKKHIDAEHCFDDLCLLYVAMTRAKSALYMIQSPKQPKKPSDSLKPSRFLQYQLNADIGKEEIADVQINGTEYGLLYESDSSSRDWFKNVPQVEAAKIESVSGQIPADYEKKRERSRVLFRREPSKDEIVETSASLLFDRESGEKMEFGTAIHELFEKVDWLEEADIDGVIEEWRSAAAFDEQVAEDAIEQFRLCMESDVVRKELSRADGAAMLWREKSFSVVNEDELMSGIFDRVTVYHDAEGMPVRAVIADYKSSVVETEEDIERRVEGYTAQMTDYRQALAMILDLDPAKIELALVFTRSQQVRRI